MAAADVSRLGRSQYLVLLSSFVLAAAIFVVARDSDSSTASPSATFAVLKQPPIPIPAGSFTPSLRDRGTNPVRDSHLSLERGDVRTFAVAPTTSDSLCLLVVRPRVSVSSCMTKSALKADDLIYIGRHRPHGLMDVYGLVPDGIESVTAGDKAADVVRNTFFLEGAPISTEFIEIEGPEVRRVVSIGRQIPPGVTIAGED